MPKLVVEQSETVPDKITWPTVKTFLADCGGERVRQFCKLNAILIPDIHVVAKKDWHVSSCAYYRPDTPAVRKWMDKLAGGQGPGINICLEHCGRPCDDSPGRNWSWPGSDTDREPYGVICHELGHHCDWLASDQKGPYGGDYSTKVKDEAGEPGLTSYANENPWEWFAEAFRLFVTNPNLLIQLRPKTFTVIRQRWRPLPYLSWIDTLGTNVPAKVLRTLRNKGAR